MNEENEISVMVDRWAKKLKNRDIEAILADYDAEAVSYDVPPPLSVSGHDGLRRNLERWLARFEGQIDVEFCGRKIFYGGDLAFLHQLARVSDGGGGGAWVRVTLCYRRQTDGWKAVHEHISVPATMG